MDIRCKIIILFAMLWFHIVDDYYLQGILAKMKQKTLWETNAPDSLYRHDYKVALITHAFSWTFLIMLPAFILYFINKGNISFYIITALTIINTCTHAIVDNLKANKKKINLCQDQLIHLAQITISWITCVLFA